MTAAVSSVVCAATASWVSDVRFRRCLLIPLPIYPLVLAFELSPHLRHDITISAGHLIALVLYDAKRKVNRNRAIAVAATRPRYIDSLERQA
jgi:hypothetical protein